MNFNRYIVVSILTHLLLIGSLAVTHPAKKALAPIFNVSITGPIDIPALASEKIRKPRLIKKRPPITAYHRPKPPDTELLPETLYGEKTEPSTRGKDDLDEVKTLGIPEQQGFLLEKDKEASSKPDGLYPESRTFLFDRETIERFARKVVPDKKGLTFDAPEFKHRGYMRMLKQKIESIWVYPEDAIRRGISGDLYIKFSIKRDGQLGDVELLRTSGYRYLDEYAIKAVKDAEPFWPLPENWEKDELEINGHFIYILGETFIM